MAVVGPDARIRTVELGRIPSGSAPSPTDEYALNTAQPGLAVDASTGRAYVAGGMQIASVDLRTLAFAYRGAERTLQKLSTGPRRSAAWLGDGTLAVAGADDRWTEEGATSTPFGLRYVRPEGVEIVDANATAVKAAGRLALAFGHRYDAGRFVGMGLAAYDRSGALVWRLFDDASVDVQVAGGLAYVWIGRVITVVELATGSIVGSAPRPAGTFLRVLA